MEFAIVSEKVLSEEIRVKYGGEGYEAGHKGQSVVVVENCGVVDHIAWPFTDLSFRTFALRNLLPILIELYPSSMEMFTELKTAGKMVAQAYVPSTRNGTKYRDETFADIARRPEWRSKVSFVWIDMATVSEEALEMVQIDPDLEVATFRVLCFKTMRYFKPSGKHVASVGGIAKFLEAAVTPGKLKGRSMIRRQSAGGGGGGGGGGGASTRKRKRKKKRATESGGVKFSDVGAKKGKTGKTGKKAKKGEKGKKGKNGKTGRKTGRKTEKGKKEEKGEKGEKKKGKDGKGKKNFGTGRPKGKSKADKGAKDEL